MMSSDGESGCDHYFKKENNSKQKSIREQTKSGGNGAWSKTNFCNNRLEERKEHKCRAYIETLITGNTNQVRDIRKVCEQMGLMGNEVQWLTWKMLILRFMCTFKNIKCGPLNFHFGTVFNLVCILFYFFLLADWSDIPGCIHNTTLKWHKSDFLP